MNTELKAVDDLRKYLTEVRKSQSLSQTTLAERMGTVQSAISDLESGQVLDPGLNTVARWVAALGVEIHIEVEVVVRKRIPLLPRSNGGTDR